MFGRAFINKAAAYAVFVGLTACMVPLCAAQVGTRMDKPADTKYPVRPVRIVVPSTPGGGLDVMARIVTPKLTEKWGVQIVIDNRAGAGGIIGTDIVSKAAPDGHTLLLVTTGFVTNPFIIKQLPYKTPQDFEPVTIIGSTPVVLVAHPSLNVRTAKEMLALAKERPGKLTFGSSGQGSGGHLSLMLMQRVADLQFIHVPYKGAGASTAAIVGGEVNFLFTAPGAALSQVKAGRLRALAVTSAKRVGILPDVPSVTEVGLAGCVVDGWYGLLAPAGTPAALIERLYRDVLAAMKVPEIAAKLQGAGFELDGRPPAQFKQYLHDEMKRWGVVIGDAGMRAEP